MKFSVLLNLKHSTDYAREISTSYPKKIAFKHKLRTILKCTAGRKLVHAFHKSKSIQYIVVITRQVKIYASMHSFRT